MHGVMDGVAFVVLGWSRVLYPEVRAEGILLAIKRKKRKKKRKKERKKNITRTSFPSDRQTDRQTDMAVKCRVGMIWYGMVWYGMVYI